MLVDTDTCNYRLEMCQHHIITSPILTWLANNDREISQNICDTIKPQPEYLQQHTTFHYYIIMMNRLMTLYIRPYFVSLINVA